MMLPFYGHFYRVSHQPKISKHLNIMEKFELSTVEHRRIKKLDSKTKMRLIVEKYVQGIQKLVRCILFFELCEFELKEFPCKGLLVKYEGAKEFVRFR